MIIAVNTRLLIRGKLEGIGWFTYENLKRIAHWHPEHTFVFIFDRPFSEDFIFADNIMPVVAYPPARHPFLWYLWLEYSVTKKLKQLKADFFISPDGFLPLSSHIPCLNVIHDINFVHNPHDLPYFSRKYNNYFYPRFAHKAKKIATVSEFSKKDICENFKVNPQKVDVVYNGANKVYSPLPAEQQNEIKKQYTNGAEYFVFIGALHPRKNIVRLLKAFDAFRESLDNKKDIKLVIVGEAMFMTKEIEQTYKTMKHAGSIIFTGRLSPEKLRKVLASALAMSFVPYFEGFGIPILEAMYCNTPVITSNVTSMPEVAGNAALFVDPYSIESIKNGMLKMTFDENLREKLIENGKIQRENFSWDKTAKRLWNSIESCF